MIQAFYRSSVGVACTILFLWLVASPVTANPPLDPSIHRLQKNIEKLINTSHVKTSAIGIQILSAYSGEIVYEKNPDALLNPASNTKLITTAVALLKLKPEYQFTTTVHTNAPLQNGVLSGDLHLRGGGDPSLSYEGLLVLAQQVYNAGIRNITGSIVGDASFFDEEWEFSGWRDFEYAYSGRISALSLNDNAVRLQVKPASKSGGAPQVVIDPPTSYIRVVNKAVTRASKKGMATSLTAPGATNLDGETLQVSGNISPQSTGGLSAYVYVRNPALYVTTTFRDALRQLGVTTNGGVGLGTVPAKSRKVATYRSLPLAQMLRDSNKVSNNFAAEQLLKTLGAEVLGAPGTTAKGLQVAQEFLAALQIAPESYVLENGSGLSRNNRVSPAQIVTLLSYMYDHFEVRSEFLASLAVAGVDGTLERRLQDTQAERRLRAKTGAINGVSCLSGYAASRDNEVFVFSIMLNDYKTGGQTAKQIQNEIGLLLTEFVRPTYNAQTTPEFATN